MMDATIYLVELTVWDPSILAERVLRFSTGLGYVTGPNDNPANTHFKPRVLQPMNMSRRMFDQGVMYGRSTVSFGDLILLNGDGELDYLLDMALDGRQIVVYRSTRDEPRYLEDFSEVLVATMEQPEFRGDTITIRLRDRQADLNVPLQATRYAGTNSLPNGLEGTADDLKGKPKPWCVGKPKNVEPPCVNTSLLIYQVNDGAVEDVAKVYDRGAELAQEADYTDEADMLANSPSASSYRVWPSGGYFRLGSIPEGQLTCDPVQGATAADRTAAVIFEALLARAALVNEWAADAGETALMTSDGDDLATDGGIFLISLGDVSQSDITQLEADEDAELGFWTMDEVTIADVCDLVARTPGAWWGVDHGGVFRIQQIGTPSAEESVFTIRRNDLVRPLERIASRGAGLGIPAYRQVVKHSRNYTVQNSDIAGAVTAARRAQIATDWRESVAEDVTIQQAHLLSPEMIHETLYTSAADAEAEADRRLIVHGVDRGRYQATLKLTNETYRIDVGSVVSIIHDRYRIGVVGNDDGEPFLVTGVDTDAMNETVTLTLWGGNSVGYNLSESAVGGDLFVTSDGEYIMVEAEAA